MNRYDRKTASYRYRLEQYLPYLEKAGIRCQTSCLFDDRYLAIKYRTGQVSVRLAASALARRSLEILGAGRFDAVILYDEAYPYMPAWLERSLSLRGIPYLVDYDDAIFHKYDLSSSALVRWALGNKFRSLLQGALGVFAGNPYLSEYARQANSQVVELPTVVDLNRYSRVREFDEGFRPRTIGWIGSPSTAPYLRMVAPALRDFCARHEARLVIVGAGNVELSGFPLVRKDWAEETELDELCGFDLGIMPLSDDPWSRGKCGFKLIQYMACGLPVLASPVGVNQTLVEPEVNGFLCANASDWGNALERLWANPRLFSRFGKAGRKKVENEYSLAVTGPRMVSMLKKWMAGRCAG